jgi:uncharacterized pyridoxamine 5'-phosphate oxidase family protein/Pyruvate/2-oxoacid:ferredoxin oxidoreductase delta subunit
MLEGDCGLMDTKNCIQKLKLIAGVSMATVGEDGSPQVRIIGVTHVEDEKLYFLTARGKPFYRELLQERKVAICGLSRFKETIRFNGVPELLPKEEQSKWLEIIFSENPYMKNVYPDDTRRVLEVFCVQSGEIEYFNMGVRPIVRESYVVGNGVSHEKLYKITDGCVGCGDCIQHCSQKCIDIGTPCRIEQKHCLRCGACKEICPHNAVIYGEE